MDRIWAPWRMDYITAGPGQDCFLCRAWESEDPEANLVLRKGTGAFVIMNRYPYNNGHLMVSVARHVGELALLDSAESSEIMALVTLSVEALKTSINPHGFNVGLNLGQVAGAGLEDHLHVHIVPRWSGDTNFMPLLGETKVISEHLEATYRKLQAAFETS